MLLAKVESCLKVSVRWVTKYGFPKFCFQDILIDIFFLIKKKYQLTDRLKEGRFDTLISGVKNFLPTNKLLTVTRLVEALMDSSSASNQSLAETDEYIFLDPRAPRLANAGMPGVAGGSGLIKGKRMAFTEGMVFIVGGAGYVEYGNIQEWATKASKRVTYGGTDIMDPKSFVKILESLGKSGS